MLRGEALPAPVTFAPFRAPLLRASGFVAHYAINPDELASVAGHHMFSTGERLGKAQGSGEAGTLPSTAGLYRYPSQLLPSAS